MRLLFPYFEINTAVDGGQDLPLFICPADPRGDVRFGCCGAFAEPFGLT
jgi:hypothetical protein